MVTHIASEGVDYRGSIDTPIVWPIIPTMDDDEASFSLYGDLADGFEISPEEQRQIEAAVCLPGQTTRDQTSSEKQRSCTNCSSLSSQLMASQCTIAELKTNLTQKDSKLTISTRQNGILLRNLSQLFTTAQVEIEKWKKLAVEAGVDIQKVASLPLSSSPSSSTATSSTTTVAASSPASSTLASPTPSSASSHTRKHDAPDRTTETQPPHKKPRTEDQHPHPTTTTMMTPTTVAQPNTK